MRRTFVIASSSSAARETQNHRNILHHEWICGGKVVKKEGGANNGEAKVGRSSDHATVLFLHGLLGSGKNLRGVAKKLTERHPHISALLLDARGHGGSSSSTKYSHDRNRSSIFDPPHNFSSAAKDVLHTVNHLGLAAQSTLTSTSKSSSAVVGVVGHSFGGRVALEYLRHTTTAHAAAVAVAGSTSSNKQLKNSKPPITTWLLDCVPGVAHGSITNVVNAVSSVPLPIPTHGDLVTFLVNDQNVDPTIARWMTTNLVPAAATATTAAVSSSSGSGSSGFEFAFDLNIVKELIHDFPRQDFHGILHEIKQAATATAIKTASSSSSSSSQSLFSDRRMVCEVNLVRAGKNRAWTTDVINNLKQIETTSEDDEEERGRDGVFDGSRAFEFRSHVLEDAGHWVHVDDLEGLLDIMDSSFHPSKMLIDIETTAAASSLSSSLNSS